MIYTTHAILDSKVHFYQHENQHSANERFFHEVLKTYTGGRP